MKAEEQIKAALNGKGYEVLHYQYSQPVWASDGPEGGYFITLNLHADEADVLENLNIQTHAKAGDNLRHLTYFEAQYLIGYKKECILDTIKLMPRKWDLTPINYERN